MRTHGARIAIQPVLESNCYSPPSRPPLVWRPQKKVSSDIRQRRYFAGRQAFASVVRGLSAGSVSMLRPWTGGSAASRFDGAVDCATVIGPGSRGVPGRRRGQTQGHTLCLMKQRAWTKVIIVDVAGQPLARPLAGCNSSGELRDIALGQGSCIHFHWQYAGHRVILLVPFHPLPIR